VVVVVVVEEVAEEAEEEEEEEEELEEGGAATGTGLGGLTVASQWSHVGGLLRQDTLASLRAARSMVSACCCWMHILEIKQDKSRLNTWTLL